MSTLDRVREKYKAAIVETGRTSKSPSAGFVGPKDERIESCEGVIDLDHERIRRDAERARQRRAARLWGVMEQLKRAPASVDYVWKADPDLEPDHVVVSVAIRGKGACELTIPREKWDLARFIELIDGDGPEAT